MIFLLDMPPPIHGMSNINESFYEVAKKNKLNPKVINTAPSRYSKHFNSKLWTLLKLIRFTGSLATLLGALLTTNNKVIYRPINGGAGQIYDIAFLLTCRLLNQKIFIHHHSFQYINKRSKLFKTLIRLSGTQTTHIVLSAHMAKRLADEYSISSEKIFTISNSSFFEPASTDSVQTDIGGRKIVIGHLANLCTEKGLDIFSEICNELATRGMDFSARIAGPCADELSEKIVTNLCSSIPQVEYLGPLYGEAKNSFFESIDTFIFPSKYKNEAEPLVLYEAACKGAFLIGSTAGCMKDTIETLNGLCRPISDEKVWIQVVADYLQDHQHKISDNQEREKRIEVFNALLSESKTNLKKFILDLSNAAA